jgi:hypothetical protein
VEDGSSGYFADALVAREQLQVLFSGDLEAAAAAATAAAAAAWQEAQIHLHYTCCSAKLLFDLETRKQL